MLCTQVTLAVSTAGFSTPDSTQAKDMQKWWCTLDSYVYTLVSRTAKGSRVLCSLRKRSSFPSSWQFLSRKCSSKFLITEESLSSGLQFSQSSAALLSLLNSFCSAAPSSCWYSCHPVQHLRAAATESSWSQSLVLPRRGSATGKMVYKLCAWKMTTTECLLLCLAFCTKEFC